MILKIANWFIYYIFKIVRWKVWRVSPRPMKYVLNTPVSKCGTSKEMTYKILHIQIYMLLLIMHCKLLTMLVLILLQRVQWKTDYIIMLKKMMQFFINEDDGLVNIKNIYLICITILCVLSYIVTGYLVNCQDVADVCGGDGYAAYHSN